MTRVRESLQTIQYLYDSNTDRSKLENLIRAFRGIQALPSSNPNSFFHISGLHGLPYRGPGETDPEWWGGYCCHETVLFPTWHRAYLLRLEDALRSIAGCQDVTIPYWDELDGLLSLLGQTTDKQRPIPSVLTSPTFDLDNRTDNPLYSYKLQTALSHKVDGLVGTKEDQDVTTVHNARFSQSQQTQELNDNVAEWLCGTVDIPDDDEHSRRPDTYSVNARYLRCLSAPNYTVFSNTSSQNQWIKEHKQSPSSHYVVSLESPHNAIHLAVGGFYQKGVYNASPIRGANGDMGDNETAGFDPIFFLHHCFIDYVFAMWQRLWGLTERGSLSVIQGYDGTILTDGQPPNFAPGTSLDVTTPLLPFEKTSGGYYTSNDVTSLKELGIAYGVGSLHILINVMRQLGSIKMGVPFNLEASALLDLVETSTVKGSLSGLNSDRLNLRLPSLVAGSDPNVNNPFPLTKWVHNINRSQYKGSFVIRLYATGHDGKEIEVGREAVLSRWNVGDCANCQSHLDVEFYVPIDKKSLQFLQGINKAEVGWRVEIQAHDELHQFPHIPTPGKGSRSGDQPNLPKVGDLQV